MKTKDEIIAILRNFKEEFGERYGIEKLGLFGSVARGEQKEDSDIDICVKLQDPDYFIRTSNPQLSSSASFLRLNVLSSLN